ncbi:MAG: hypothetical protein WBA57_00640 [Elainellaceae cyanobacterium]
MGIVPSCSHPALPTVAPPEPEPVAISLRRWLVGVQLSGRGVAACFGGVVVDPSNQTKTQTGVLHIMNISDPGSRPPVAQAGLRCDENHAEKIQVIAVGKPLVVEQFIRRMHHARFAKPYEWSAPLPSPSHPGEIMRTVIKQIPVPES